MVSFAPDMFVGRLPGESSPDEGIHGVMIPWPRATWGKFGELEFHFRIHM